VQVAACPGGTGERPAVGAGTLGDSLGVPVRSDVFLRCQTQQQQLLLLLLLLLLPPKAIYTGYIPQLRVVAVIKTVHNSSQAKSQNGKQCAHQTGHIIQPAGPGRSRVTALSFA
jgi:hypothetical protein